MVDTNTYKKREPTAIGSLGLPHPYCPIYAESPRARVSVSHLFSEQYLQCGRLSESSNKANASFNQYVSRVATRLLLILRRGGDGMLFYFAINWR